MTEHQVSDACAQAGALTDEHELLKQFEGSWRSSLKMWMGGPIEDGGRPAEPMESAGMMKSELILGGRFLSQEYKDDNGMFEGRGLFGYNTVEKRWEGLWVDSMATFMMTERGSYDAATKTWTMSDEMLDPGSGHMMRKRSVLTVESESRHTMAMYFTPLAGKNEGVESKCMEIVYERA